MKIRDVERFLRENGVPFSVKAPARYPEEVSGYCPLNALRDGCLIWARESRYLAGAGLEKYHGLWVISPPFDGWEQYNVACIFVDDPFSVYFSVMDAFLETETADEEPKIGRTSVVRTKDIGKNVKIGEHCVICEGTQIADGVTIHDNVSIECPTRIGRNSTILAGAVIGDQGFGYFTDIHGERKRVPHIGGVVIGEDCQIGENSVISRGCLGDTVIGDHVRIACLSHIAHNCKVQDGAYVVCALVGGSAEIGKDSWLSLGSAVTNGVRVENNTVVGLGAAVTRDTAEGGVVVGVPAREIRKRRENEEL